MLAYRLQLRRCDHVELVACVHTCWNNKAEAQRRNGNGVLISSGVTTIYYSSTLQSCVTLSSAEAEFVTVSESGGAVMWCQRILHDVGILRNATPVYQFDKGCIVRDKSNEARKLDRRERIHVRYHSVTELIRNGSVV